METQREQLARELLHLAPLLFRSVLQTSKRTLLPDIPPTQLQALMLLGRARGGVCMTQLAEELRISRQQFTKVAGALEERGFIRREVSAENRRMVLLSLTGEGGAYLSLLEQELLGKARQRFAALSDREVQVLLQAKEILQLHFGKDLTEKHE